MKKYYLVGDDKQNIEKIAAYLKKADVSVEVVGFEHQADTENGVYFWVSNFLAPFKAYEREFFENIDPEKILLIQPDFDHYEDAMEAVIKKYPDRVLIMDPENILDDDGSLFDFDEDFFSRDQYDFLSASLGSLKGHIIGLQASEVMVEMKSRLELQHKLEIEKLNKCINDTSQFYSQLVNEVSEELKVAHSHLVNGKVKVGDLNPLIVKTEQIVSKDIKDNVTNHKHESLDQCNKYRSVTQSVKSHCAINFKYYQKLCSDLNHLEANIQLNNRIFFLIALSGLLLAPITVYLIMEYELQEIYRILGGIAAVYLFICIASFLIMRSKKSLLVDLFLNLNWLKDHMFKIEKKVHDHESVVTSYEKSLLKKYDKCCFWINKVVDATKTAQITRMNSGEEVIKAMKKVGIALQKTSKALNENDTDQVNVVDEAA